MLGDVFALDIRPTFVDELDEAMRYIEVELENPGAADRLEEDVFAAIRERLAAPTAFQPCYEPPDVRQPYYRIQVRNFTIFYVVIGKVMEVRWFRYGRSQQPLVEHPRWPPTPSGTTPYP